MYDEAFHSKLETLYLPQSRAAQGERKLAFRFFLHGTRAGGEWKVAHKLMIINFHNLNSKFNSKRQWSGRATQRTTWARSKVFSSFVFQVFSSSHLQISVSTANGKVCGWEKERNERGENETTQKKVKNNSQVEIKNNFHFFLFDDSALFCCWYR